MRNPLRMPNSAFTLRCDDFFHLDLLCLHTYRLVYYWAKKMGRAYAVLRREEMLEIGLKMPQAFLLNAGVFLRLRQDL